MKKSILMFGAASLMAAMFAAGCASADTAEEEMAANRAKLAEFEKGAVAYKNHEKQKEKYVLPNASLETSRALYLPIGGAIAQQAITLFGDSYVRMASETLHAGNAKRWTSLKADFGKGKASSAYKELLVQVENFIKNNPPGLDSDQIYKTKPEVLLDKVIQNTRVADSYAFNKEYNGAKDDAERKAILEEKQKADYNLTAWLGLTKAEGKTSPSQVYRDYEAAKQAMLKKLEEESANARKEAAEAYAKTGAFIAFWGATVGKKVYPVIVPMVPVQAPVDAALTLSIPVADKAFGTAIDSLAGKYPFLPTSLDPDFSVAPNLRKLVGSDSMTMNTLMDKLSDKAFVESLLDKELIAKVKDPKGYVMKNMNVSNPLEIPGKISQINKEIGPVLESMGSIKANLDKEDYAQVSMDLLGTFGNAAGKDLVAVIQNEFKPYKYANEIAGKRIEFTNEAIKWLVDGTLEDLAASGAF